MVINFLGDSITEGVGASSFEKMYVEIVRNSLSCEINNYGISGTRIARQRKPSNTPSFDLDFQLRAEKMKKSDLLFVFGGTNDWGHGDAPIGNPNDKDPYSFYGGMNNLIEIILKSYNKNDVYFILPLHRKNEDSPYGESFKEKPSVPLKGYVDAMKEVLKTHNIKYIDLFENGPKFSVEFFADDVHPNDNGHKYLANIIIKTIQSRKDIK